MEFYSSKTIVEKFHVKAIFEPNKLPKSNLENNQHTVSAALSLIFCLMLALRSLKSKRTNPLASMDYFVQTQIFFGLSIAYDNMFKIYYFRFTSKKRKTQSENICVS